MAIAQGRSNIRAEIDIVEQSLRNMISSIEANFNETIVSLKARIFDIERETEDIEEAQDRCTTYLNELEDYEVQRFHARNKIVIIIYSICEASLAEICAQYQIQLKFSPQNKAKRDYYLSDYLFSIGIDYSSKDACNSSYIVTNVIRLLRNYLTHCSIDQKKATDIVSLMKDVGLLGIRNRLGNIYIESKDILLKILDICKKMLLKGEAEAKQKRNQYLKI